ncbi:MAG: AAA family ATPase, partial [Clostridia bacterium]|nr:AAA family ATPase [Clostridia bacterium]
KTTIARILAKVYKESGLLSKGHLVEVGRADLVGKYVGHTAPLTMQVIKSAIGGVLFIDEAYSLYRGHDDSFGLEAIDTLVKGMEDNRDDLIVILAGYTHEMEVFLTANSGLRSRFPNIIEFPDYTGEELTQIAEINASSKGYRLSDDARGALLDYFTVIQAMEDQNSGNGRLARNIIESAILAQAKRIVREPEAPLDLLEKRDFDLFEAPEEEDV